MRKKVCTYCDSIFFTSKLRGEKLAKLDIDYHFCSTTCAAKYGIWVKSNITPTSAILYKTTETI